MARQSEQPIRVLFLCVGNSCRSQMAEALLRHHGGDRFDVYSAGTIAAGVHPMTLRALDEIGIDARRQWSKHWEVYRNEPPFDYVIAVCEPSAQDCPFVPLRGKRLAWPFEDPIYARGSEEDILKVFRRVRDAIAKRILEFVREVAEETKA